MERVSSAQSARKMAEASKPRRHDRQPPCLCSVIRDNLLLTCQANAYVSGMKEEINIVGNQYNYFTTLFNVGYVLVIYPSCIAVSHFGPHYWLPSAELIWGVLTCCLSVAQNYKHVYALRFLIGFAEGTAWPGYITVMSQWYMPQEVALRMGFFTMAQSVGSMFAGIMQGALSTTLDGSLGRSGWR